MNLFIFLQSYIPQRHSAQIIALIIMFIFILGVKAAIDQAGRFNTLEYPALDRVKRLVAENYCQDEVAVGMQEATRHMVEISVLMEAIDKSSRVADRLATIADMKARHVAISLKILQEITLAQERACTSMSLPTFAANLSMLLGLLGTFFGLNDMVGTLGAVVGGNVLNSIQEWQDAVSSLRSALGGMQTAFICSLYGMLSAAILSFLAFRINDKQARFLNDLEAFSARDLLPATVLATEEQTVLERATLTIEDAFERLSNIQAHNNETLQSLDGVQKTFLSMLETLRSQTADKESRNLDAAMLAMGELAGRIPDLVDAIDRTNTALREGLGELSHSERKDRRLRNLLIRNGFRRLVAVVAGRKGTAR